MKEQIRNIWLLLFIIIQPILDIISYFQEIAYGVSYTWIIRILALLIFLLIIFIKSKNKKKLVLYLLPFLIYFVLHFINLYRINQLSIVDEIKYYIMTFQSVIITIYLIEYLKNSSEDLKIIKLSMFLNFIIIAYSIFLSYITHSYVYTYGTFGITGWFNSANTASMVLCAIVPWSIYYCLEKENKTLFSCVLVVSFIIMYFNATRACYFSFILSIFILLYCSLFKKNSNNRKFNIIILSIFLLLPIILYNNSFTSDREIISKNVVISDNINISNVINTSESECLKKILKAGNDISNVCESDAEKKKEIIKVLKSSYIYRDIIDTYGEDKVYQYFNQTFNISMLSNNRYMKKINAKIVFDNSDFITKMFGIGYGRHEIKTHDLENDLTAIWLYYGYVGFSLYILIYVYLLLLAVKYFINNKNAIFDIKFIFIIFLIALLLFGGEYSGALLRKPNANIYVAILLVISYFNCIIPKKTINKSKLTFLNLHLGYGGIETATINSANALSKEYDVEIISFYNLGKNQSSLLDKKVHIKYLCKYNPNKDKFLSSLRKFNIYKTIKEGIVAIIILFQKKYKLINEIRNSDSFAIISTRYDFSVLLSKYGRKDCIKIAQEHHHHNNNNKYIKILSKKYKNINYLCALTKTLKKDYQKFLKDNKFTKVVLLPNILPVRDINYFSTKSSDIICVSRLHSGKNIDQLLYIFSNIKNKKNKLYIIGSGEEEANLKLLTKQLSLSDRVIFTGFIDKNEQINYYRNSALFAMTSVTEGLPMTLLESMQCGIPCIAFETDSGVKDIIKNGYNGYVVKNRSTTLYIDRIDELLDNKSKLAEFSQNCILTAKQFGPDKILKIWKKILK